MKKILVLGASGQVARWVIEMLAGNGNRDVEMTLYLLRAHKLHDKDPQNAKVLEGGVLDRKTLDAARRG